MKKWLSVTAMCIICVAMGVRALGADSDADQQQRYEEAKRKLAERQRAAAAQKARAATRPVIVLHPVTLPSSLTATPPGPTTSPAAVASAANGTATTTRPTTAPAAVAVPPAPRQPVRPVKEIREEFQREDKLLGSYKFDDLVSPKMRVWCAREIAPHVHHRLELAAELERADPATKAGLRDVHARDLALLALYGDAVAAKTLTELSKSQTTADAVVGRAGLFMRDWWTAADAERQQAMLPSLRELSVAAPRDEVVFYACMDVARGGAASEELANAARDIVESTLSSPAAMRYKARPDKIGRPLVVNGVTFEGKPFSTASWKGKVVVLDFWATWCGPCRAALPKVAQLYHDNHDRGLEIVGLACDARRPDLKKFLAEHPEIVWPQLWAPTGPLGYHALAYKYEIGGVPTMYVIDRNGILRDSELGRIPEDTILKLLDEKPKTAAPTHPATPLTRPSTPLAPTRPAVRAPGAAAGVAGAAPHAAR